MTTDNPLKRKLRAGQACFGAWMLSTSADMAEVLAYAGMDFLVLDHEHGQGGIDDAVGQLRAIKGTDCVGVLRVPANDHIYIKRALDAGVGGIMVPSVNDAEQARPRRSTTSRRSLRSTKSISSSSARAIFRRPWAS